MKKIALLAICLTMIISISACAQSSVSSSLTLASSTSTESIVPTTSTAVPSSTAAETTTTTAGPTTAATTTKATTSLVVYKNDQYGFQFSLPKSWQGYSVLTDKWQGIALTGSQSGKVVETGPIISLRHPKWTTQIPRQDIPIMVFTLAQWNLVQKEQISVGAAPVGPSELGRNAKYVFALPARYNYAFLPGFEEVEAIIKGDPLQAT
jgi:H+/gluconate symporter-like permease